MYATIPLNSLPSIFAIDINLGRMLPDSREFVYEKAYRR